MVKKPKRGIKCCPSLKKPKQKYAGVHLIAEFWGAKDIESPKKLEELLILSAKKANAKPLEVKTFKFSPQGISGMVLLAESHISLHSWPEMGYIAIDIFTCGSKAKPKEALKYLKKVLKPQKVKIIEIKRGEISEGKLS